MKSDLPTKKKLRTTVLTSILELPLTEIEFIDSSNMTNLSTFIRTTATEDCWKYIEYCTEYVRRIDVIPLLLEIIHTQETETFIEKIHICFYSFA